MIENKKLKIAIGVTGSYEKIDELKPIIKNFLLKDYTVKIFGTTSLKNHSHYVKDIEELVGEKVIYSLEEAEPFGPQKYFDVMLIAPMSGNTLSKLANAVTDNAVLMAAKSTLRNLRPVVIGVSTNDALGLNGTNLMKLLMMKNMYFIPFGQDDPEEKPNSLVSDFTKTEETIYQALKGKQIQPIIITKSKRDDNE